MKEQKNIKRCLSLSVVILLLDCVHVATPKIVKGPLSNEDRKKFLIAHNNYRRDASKEFEGVKQPPAAYMKRLYWSAGLEAEAVAWTATMVANGEFTEGYTGVQYLDVVLVMLGNPGRKTVGQNIARKSLDPNAVVKMWYNETKLYTYNTNQCSKKDGCLHYTQVMWANSHYLGCAFGQGEGIITSYAACQYFPSGDVTMKTPYTEGGNCSLCASQIEYGFYECDNGLCQPKDKCSPVRECRVVDMENCLCSESDYEEMVKRLVQANGLRLAPSSLLLMFSVVVVGLLISPLDIA